MITRDSWWNQNSRPILKQGLGAVACADVETADLGDGIVTSEKATAALRSHSVQLVLENATASDAAGHVAPCSTGNVVWRPRQNINILRIQRISLGLEALVSTCETFNVYGGTGAPLIASVAVSCGSPAAYTRTDMGTISNPAVAACTDLLLQRVGSTCSQTARSAFQIDYETSG